jgi:hypothetical protein
MYMRIVGNRRLLKVEGPLAVSGQATVRHERDGFERVAI